MFFGSRQYDRKTGTSLSRATAPVVEQLEQRQLLAADIIPVEWQGRTIEAHAGEWIVGLQRPEPTYDAEEDVVNSNIQYTKLRRGRPPVFEQHADQRTPSCGAGSGQQLS